MTLRRAKWPQPNAFPFDAPVIIATSLVTQHIYFNYIANCCFQQYSLVHIKQLLYLSYLCTVLCPIETKHPLPSFEK